MKNFWFCLYFCSSLLSASLFSQQESGIRFIDKESWQRSHFWYDSSTSMFQLRYPIIKRFPPLNSGMPYEIMASYILIDSMLRFTSINEPLNIIKLMSGMNDTLRYGVKYFYKIKEYDATLFRQYEDEVTLNRKNQKGIVIKRKKWDTSSIQPPPSPSQWFGYFNSHLSDVTSELVNKYLSNVPINEKKAIRAILFSDYILRVRIVEIDSTTNKNSPLGYKRYNVIAEVLDTLKGKIIKAGIEYSSNKQLKENKLTSTPTPAITFQFTPKKYIGYGISVSSQTEPQIRDSVFSDSRGEFRMLVAQEAIVFLVFSNGLLDYEYDYYDLDVCSYCSNNALPVIEGNVRDVGLIWSNELLMPYEDWKTRFIELKNKILDLSY